MPFRGWQKTRVPLVESARESESSAILPTGVFRSLRNCVYETPGRIRASNAYSILSGSTGFDSAYSSNPDMGSAPHRLFELDSQQLVSDRNLWGRDSVGGAYRPMGPLRPLQMLQPKQVIGTSNIDTSSSLAEHSMATCAGYTIYAWLGEDTGSSTRAIYTRLLDEATGAWLTGATFVDSSTTADIGTPVLVAGSRYVYVLWWADGEINGSRFDTQSPTTGFGAASTLTTEANSKQFDAALTTVGGNDRIYVAFDKNDGSLAGLGVESFDTTFSMVDEYELDHAAPARAFSVLASVGSSLIWVAYASQVVGSDRTLLFLLTTSLSVTTGPVTLASVQATHTGLGYVDDASYVLALTQLSNGSGTSYGDVYGHLRGQIISSGGFAISSFTSDKSGFIMTGQPFKVEDLTLVPVMMRSGAGTPDKIVEALVAVTSVGPGGGWIMTSGVRPELLCGFARGVANPTLSSPGTLTKMVSFGNGEFGYARHVHTLQQDASSPASIALQDYRWLYSSDPLLHQTQLSAEYDGGLYFSGALTMFSDGSISVDVGFPVKPELSSTHFTASASGGAISQGVYQYHSVYEWLDGKGRRHQSRPSDIITLDLSATAYAGGSNRAVILLRQPVTRARTHNFQHVVYRTNTTGSAPGSVFYRTISDDESVGFPTAASNGYRSFSDSQSNAAIEDNAFSYVSQGHQEHEPPPATHHIAVLGQRLAAIDAEDRERIVFSAPMIPGEVAVWNSVWQQRIEGHGPLTALAAIDGKLYAFTETSIHIALWGEGPAITNQGAAFAPPDLIADSVGATDPRSVVVGQDGVYFAGRYENDIMLFRLPRGDGTPEPIGDAVRETLQQFPNITSAVVVQRKSQIRWTAVNDAKTASVVLVYDYSMRDRQGNGYWYVWDFSGAILHAAVWDGVHRLIVDATSTAIYSESSEPYASTALATLGHMWPAGIMTPARLKALSVYGQVEAQTSASAKPSLYVGLSYDGGRTYTSREFSVSEASGAHFTRRVEPRRQRLDDGSLVVRLGLKPPAGGSANTSVHAFMVEWNPDGDGPRLVASKRK